MINKFKEGESVYAKANPDIPLTVNRCISNMYYCKIVGDSDIKELVFFEHEIAYPEPPL